MQFKRSFEKQGRIWIPKYDRVNDYRFNKYKQRWEKVRAAISYDSNGGIEANAPASITWNHTCTGASVLVVGVGVVDTSGGGPASVLSITYGVTNNLSFIRRDPQPSKSNASEIWFLANPPTGTAAILVTFTTTPNITGAGGSVSLIGSATTVNANNGSVAASGQPGTVVTTTVDNAWVVDVWQDNGSSDSPSATSPSVRRVSVAFGGTDRPLGMSTQGPVSPAGGATMAWTGFTDGWAQSAAAFGPASASTPLTEALSDNANSDNW